MVHSKRFEDLKEKEIQRLVDSLGKEEPVKGVLTDDEILQYAGNSVSASKIRLKRGIGDQSDKLKCNYSLKQLYTWLICLGFLVLLLGWWVDIRATLVIILILINVMILYPLYILYIKDYTLSEFKKSTQKNEEKNIKKALWSIKENKINKNKKNKSKNGELLLLFQSKEKIAREMIEKRFPAPQLTNTKFNAVLDNCKDIVESQIENLNALTLTEKTKYEIESRKQLIKQVIRKIDDLTNELILSEQSDIENVIDEMDDLINSIKEYK
ncbi:hypothetical protein [uncultured Methanobrevibacter sp.]|uniref:hypothetical protein n=1 Tax=uncultured Methanobrevibacter sp. TaxID=253161 RepID=UPI0025E2674F|nr:hypothetical protein [uncultured Methanobrevibacter sp.]